MPLSIKLRPRTLSLAAIACALPLSAFCAGGDQPNVTTSAISKTVNSKGATKPTLYEIGYSHLDTEWCWTYPQVIREFIPNTLHDNFKLFEKYPDYTFNWTGSNRYRFMKEYYPEDYATLKKYVAAGRWFPAGSSIEEGDVNSPSEESLVRQVLYGNEFFRHEFGKASEEFMLPDCFGFPASLPSILAHCGLKGFSTQKLTWGSAVGIPFDVGRWYGPDGDYIIAALNATPYDGDIHGDLSRNSGIETLFKKIEPNGETVDYHYYGVGDRGGAPHVGSVESLETSIKGDGPIRVVGGDADQMFKDLTSDQIAQLPSYTGDLELTQHSAGSLSSEATQKRWNRKNELLGDDTERASLLADQIGALPYDKARITDAWLRFLPGQFHDLMAGTALPLAYTYAWNDQVIAMNEFAGQLQEAVGAASRNLDTRTRGTSIVVYNPLSVRREDVVEATIPSSGSSNPAIEVIDPQGHVSAGQFLSRDAGGDHVIFLAEAQPISVASFGVTDGPRSTAGARHVSSLSASKSSLENSFYRVKLNAAGDVSSIYDKRAKKELLKSPLRLSFQNENPTQYPAWNMDYADQTAPPRAYVDGPAEVKVVEDGPVRVALQVTRRAQGSRFVQTIRLSAGDAGKRVEFATQVDWQTQGCALMANFPLTVSNPLATYNWELGTVKRSNDNPKKYEVPSHKWFDLTDTSGNYGVSILDDCKYGSDKPDDSDLRLTLIYTPGTRGGYQHQGTQDIGRNIFTYAIQGHQGDWVRGNTQWEAARLNQPLLAFTTPKRSGGDGAKGYSLAQVSTNKVSIEAMKQAEESDEIIVRLNELAGQNEKNVSVRFHSPVVSAREVDGQERPIGAATISEGALVTDMKPYHPRAFAIRLQRPPHRVSGVVSHPLSLPFNLDGVSSWANKTDGNFDGSGNTLPGELLPKQIVSNGVLFKLGSSADEAKNVLTSSGQSLTLPSGTHRRLYLLAAGGKGDTNASVSFGSRGSARFRVQGWNGYIGQSDSRLWGGVVPEMAYGWDNPWIGLEPGYIKRDNVAWYADHFRKSDGTPAIYEFCYLYRYSVPIPDGATSVKLGENKSVRIMAATVANDPNDDVVAAQPLYDTVDRSGTDGPTLSATGAVSRAFSRKEPNWFSDATTISIGHPLYWGPSEKLRYTTNGSEPTASSPVASTTMMLWKPTDLTVAEFDASGRQTGPATSAFYDVHDTTAPSVLSAETMAGVNTVRVAFSEPVQQSTATSAGNYALSSGTVTSATLNPDGRSVVLTLDQPVASVSGLSMTINGVTDLAPARNAMASVRAPITPLAPAFSHPGPDVFDESSDPVSVNAPNEIPTGPSDPWTINLFVYATGAPADHSLLAGFGDGRDNNGAERYFAKLRGGIEFWGSNVDVVSGQDVALNRWQMWTATYDGKTLRIYVDGDLMKSAEVTLARARATAKIGPQPAWRGGGYFDGKTADFTIWKQALPPEYVRALMADKPTR